MANINIELPDILHKQLRLDSVRKDSTLKDHIIELLREEVSDQN